MFGKSQYNKILNMFWKFIKDEKDELFEGQG